MQLLRAMKSTLCIVPVVFVFLCGVTLLTGFFLPVHPFSLKDRVFFGVPVGFFP